MEDLLPILAHINKYINMDGDQGNMDSKPQQQKQIYSLFAQCLEHFKTKLGLVIKISQNQQYPEQQKKLYEANLNELFIRSQQLFTEYQDLQPLIAQSYQSVFIRFASRVKQILRRYTPKVKNPALQTQLQEILQEIKDAQKNNCKIRQTMIFLLIKISPQNSNNWPSKNATLLNTVKYLPQTLIPQTQKPLNKYRQAYEKGLQNLNAEFKLLGCLGIDEVQYKRSFYLGQKQNKNNYSLYQQIMQRNQYIKWLIEQYSNMFAKYTIKKTSPKKKSFKTENSQPKSEKDKISNKKAEGQNLDKPPIPNKNMIEKMRTKQIQSNHYKNLRERQSFVLINKRNHTEEALNSYFVEGESQCVSQLDNIEDGSEFKNGAHNNNKYRSTGQVNLVFPLKKVEFKDNKNLELAPHSITKRFRNKRTILRKTQQKFINKMSISRRENHRSTQSHYISSNPKIPNIKPQYPPNKLDTNICPFYTPLNTTASNYFGSKTNYNSPLKYQGHRPVQKLTKQSKLLQIRSVHSLIEPQSAILPSKYESLSKSNKKQHNMLVQTLNKSRFNSPQILKL